MRWCKVTAAIAIWLGGAACAKDATTIVTEVGIDGTVPPLLILRTSVASTSNLDLPYTSEQSSPELGDAGDRPGPFRFPLALWLTVDSGLAGPVLVSVQGLDWDTHAVVAEGSGSAEVVPQQETRAVVWLRPPTTASAPRRDRGSRGRNRCSVDRWCSR
jgi:hypothetical protein